MHKLEVFDCKFYMRDTGVKVVSKKDRRRLVDALNDVCKTKTGQSLRLVLEQVYEAKYASKPEMLTKVKLNIEKYLKCEAGLGLALVIDVIHMVNGRATYFIEMPGKKAQLIIYEEKSNGQEN